MVCHKDCKHEGKQIACFAETFILGNFFHTKITEEHGLPIPFPHSVFTTPDFGILFLGYNGRSVSH